VRERAIAATSASGMVRPHSPALCSRVSDFAATGFAATGFDSKGNSWFGVYSYLSATLLCILKLIKPNYLGGWQRPLIQ
jgi:hypothetical protein